MEYLERALKHTWLNFIIYLVIGFVLYFQILDQYFFADDISILSVASPLGGASLIDCLLPLDVGFWRPLPLSIAWLSVFLFGPSPLLFHLIPLTFHILNGVLILQICRALEWSPLKAFLAGLFFVCCASAWPAVSRMQNLMDVMIGTSVLLLVYTVLKNRERLDLIKIIPICIFGFLSKETGILLPMIAIILWFSLQENIRKETLKKEWRKIAVLISMSLLGFCIIFFLQKISQGSYTSEGRIHGSIFQMIRRLCDYGFSLFFPFIHLMEAPFKAIHLSHSTLQIIRLFFLALLIGILIFSFRKNRFFCGLCLTAILLLLPATLLHDPMRGRYVYASIGPGVILIMCLITSIRPDRIRFFAWFSLAVLSLHGVAGIMFSPTVLHYERTTDDVEQLMSQVAIHSEAWSKGDRVAIFQHPYPSHDPYRWTYSQQLLNLFLREKEITLLLDYTDATTDKAYIFSNGELQEFETQYSAE